MKKALISRSMVLLLICSLFMFCSASTVLAATQVSDQSGNGSLNYERTFTLSESGDYSIILGGKEYNGSSIHYILSQKLSNGTYRQILYVQTPSDGSSYFKIMNLSSGTYSLRIVSGGQYYFAYNIYKR